ncbi:MAG: 50S ribosomal protein L18 [Candidatus Woesebacteria bacterium GW2011_GWA1_37_7]|uniref:Large ribosomal subunit protein uL18 n=1 Tax=Candidatus Woesebacteria bacterium GW2011_GWA1_37_7 TaxID=1618545 RepID=A0A0G0K9W8_9BACT|nr:MAG: 50S ribosomal protein L18 [Candidatus Woesebacteria bacterium GW2011_GWA1_37_7]
MNKKAALEKRKKRVRSKIFGTSKRPRLSVFRSKRHTYAQIIDDAKGITLVSVSDLELTKDSKSKSAKVVVAMTVGEALAKKAIQKKIKDVTFDRGGRKYHGRIKSLAEGARKGGLKF